MVMSLVMFAAIALMALVLWPAASWAAGYQGNQSNQAIQQPARLVAPEPDAKIAIYPQPDTRKRRIGYGMGGDAVTVLEQVGSNQGVTWHRIRFDNDAANDAAAEGWVQGAFLLLQTASEPSRQGAQTADSGNRYLGGQAQSSYQNRSPSSSQQTQY